MNITKEQLIRYLMLSNAVVNNKTIPLSVRNKQTGKDEIIVCLAQIIPGSLNIATVPIAKIFDPVNDDLSIYEVPEGAMQKTGGISTNIEGDIEFLDLEDFDPNKN